MTWTGSLQTKITCWTWKLFRQLAYNAPCVYVCVCVCGCCGLDSFDTNSNLVKLDWKTFPEMHLFPQNESDTALPLWTCGGMTACSNNTDGRTEASRGNYENTVPQKRGSMQKRRHVIGEGKRQQVWMVQTERERKKAHEWVCVCVSVQETQMNSDLWHVARTAPGGVRGHMASVWAPIERSNTLWHVSLTSLCNTQSATDGDCVLHVDLFAYLCLHLVCVCEFIYIYMCLSLVISLFVL